MKKVLKFFWKNLENDLTTFTKKKFLEKSGK